MVTLNIHSELTDSLAVKKLMDYFLISDFSQTYFYTGHVSSLKYLLQEKEENKVRTVIDRIEESLHALYSTYYPSVKVSVSPIYEKDSNVYNIAVNVIVKNKEGNTFELSDRVAIDNPYNNKYIAELKKR